MKKIPVYQTPYTAHRASQELKSFDITAASCNMNTGGTVQVLNLPVVGTDYDDRIGRKITIKSVYVRGFGYIQAAATGGSAQDAPIQLHRMILVWDKQPNAAIAAITDILAIATSSSHLNLNNRDRFLVLKDKQWVVGPLNATQGLNGNCGYPIKVYKKMNFEAVYNGTNGGTIADITTGALLLVTIGDVASGLDDGVANVKTRIRFVDS